MLTVAALAAMDPLALKESVTVVAPDHKPLLAVVGMIGECLRQQSSVERGLLDAVADTQIARVGCVILSSCYAFIFHAFL